MAIRYVYRNGEMVPVDSDGRTISDIDSYTIKYSTVEGGKRGTKDEYNKALEIFLSEGRIPEYYEISPKKGREAYNNIVKGLEKFKTDEGLQNYEQDFKKYGGIMSREDKEAFDKLPPEEQDQIIQGNKPSDRPYTSADDFFDWDNPDSIGGKLYETYKEINQGQYESSKLESQYQERDMNRAMAGERQALMDQIRDDRRRSLKSGLSQSAIANREIQGLLQGQSMASGYADEFLRERRQLNQMGRNIDSMSKGNVLDTYNQGLGNMMAAMGTNDASNANTQFKNFLEMNTKQQKDFYSWMYPDSKK